MQNDIFLLVVCVIVLTVLFQLAAFPSDMPIGLRFLLATGFVALGMLVWKNQPSRHAHQQVGAAQPQYNGKASRIQAHESQVSHNVPPSHKIEPMPPINPEPSPEHQRLVQVLTRGHESIHTTPFYSRKRHQSPNEDLYFPDPRSHSLLLSNTDPHIKREDGKLFKGHKPSGTPLF